MTSVPPTSTPPRQPRRDLAVAMSCGVVAALMVGAAYAAVPLYDWFCRTTGFGGTTQVATAGPAGMLDRIITVRFDANVSGGLPWKFAPEQTSIKVRLGEVVTVNYNVANVAARETAGIASYNVSPPTAGAYFNKINCFCFSDQEMHSGEKREMPVVFYVDPEILKHEDLGDIDTITLSYTFHAVRDAKPTASRAPDAKQAGAPQSVATPNVGSAPRETVN